MDRYIGRLLDNRYEILEVLGTGGMAVVYKARCHRLNRLVAIKILKDDYTQDEEFRRRFQAESQAVAMLSHPNIVSVYDVSSSDDADFIVMELIDGITLKQYMEKKGVLNWKETLHFAIQIGKALEHAHSRGIIHRDIKPHNVMVLKNGSVKVTDFGIARVMSKSNTLTKEALGSVHYISPEQAKGGRVDNRSDIYSLGVVMYEMMTGRPPYDGESPVAVAIQHINGQAAMPSTINPNIPGGLEQIMMRAMAQEPAKRYSTAHAMLFDMDEFRKDPTILFDYNNTSTGMDDAVQLSNNAHRAAPVPVAVEKAAARTPAGARRPTAPAKSPNPKPRKRVEEVVEEEDRSSKVATIAIAACSVVLVVAIAIILFVGMGSDAVTSPDMITVPNLLGQPLNEAVKNKDIIIKHEYAGYSDEYDKDEIISQKPEANTQIAKGGIVTVVVSMGKQPEGGKYMMNLTSTSEAEARRHLIEILGVEEKYIITSYEPSTSVTAGLITRTEPGEGAELKPGTTIKLWVSTGKQVKTAKMPNLLGHNVDTAVRLLNNTGFSNVTVEEVDSNKSPNTVVGQSVQAEREVDVNTPIVLQIPKAGGNTVITPNPLPTEPEDYVTKVVTLKLPEDMNEDYVLTVRRDGTILEERKIPAGALELQIELSGKGTMEFEIWIGDSPEWIESVEFESDDEDDDGEDT